MVNTTGLPPPSARAVSRIYTGRPHSGTRCSRLAFIRVAGTVHTRFVRSIPAHSASRSLPPHPAVITSRSYCCELILSRRQRPGERETRSRTHWSHDNRAPASHLYQNPCLLKGLGLPVSGEQVPQVVDKAKN